MMGELKPLQGFSKLSASSCFKAAEAALGKSYGIHADSVFSIGSQNGESQLDAVE
jgi:hypothetical protein